MGHTLTFRPAFTPLMIVLMVCGFLLAWPLGLLMLAYMLWGDRITEFRRDGASMVRNCCGFGYEASPPVSGNGAFDEYRKQELKRLEDERRRLDEERREFESYAQDLRRAKDKEEFDRFMADRNAPKNGSDAP